MGKWAKAHPRRNYVEQKCPVCGSFYSVPQWKINQGKGRYCSKPCYRVGSRSPDGVEYDGLWFGRTGKNKYYWHKWPDKTTVSLHKYVWMEANGPVPDGFVVHHIDHDPANNALENLESIEISEHARLHVKKRIDEGTIDLVGSLAKAREKAKEWHRSPEGKEWHRQHAYNSICKGHKPSDA